MFQTQQHSSFIFLKSILPISMLLYGFFYIPFTYGQDWPATTGNTQPEFEVKRPKKELHPKKNQAVSRGQLHTPTSHTQNLGQLIRREVINPFESGTTRTSAPLVQSLPAEVEIPEIPNVLIYEQINLDEFRNYLESLIAEPPTPVKPNYSEADIKKALSKVNIQTLAVTPKAYVVINKNRFQVGDRFSLAMPPVKYTSNIETLIESQMPNKEDVSVEVYQKFIEIKNQAITAYSQRQQEYLKKIGAHKHNISVIVKNIKHRKLIVSVHGKAYVIPLRLTL